MIHKPTIHKTKEYLRYLETNEIEHIDRQLAYQYWKSDISKWSSANAFIPDVRKKKMSELRVVCWNVHAGLSPLEDFDASQDIYDVLEFLTPDIICLQEFKKDTLLAQKLVLRYSHSYICETQEGIANAAFSNFPISSCDCIDIHHKKVYLKLNFQIPSISRKPNFIINLYNVHLTVANDEYLRVKQLKALLQTISKDDEAIIILGDFNSPLPIGRSGDKKVRELIVNSGFDDVFNKTRPPMTCMFGQTVDFIYSYAVDVTSAGAYYTPASDHLPLYVDLVYNGNSSHVFKK